MSLSFYALPQIQEAIESFVGTEILLYAVADHLIWDCPKDLSWTAQKAHLNMKEVTAKNAGQTLRSQ